MTAPVCIAGACAILLQSRGDRRHLRPDLHTLCGQVLATWGMGAPASIATEMSRVARPGRVNPALVWNV